mmetsp:Transcript_25234/g.59861  ORF Transcript_25234/g.59861 Transcript_25234/m.59861 type:complete len:264 (+) Transcript_25234:23-814(+)
MLKTRTVLFHPLFQLPSCSSVIFLYHPLQISPLLQTQPNTRALPGLSLFSFFSSPLSPFLVSTTRSAPNPSFIISPPHDLNHCGRVHPAVAHRAHVPRVDIARLRHPLPHRLHVWRQRRVELQPREPRRSGGVRFAVPRRADSGGAVGGGHLGGGQLVQHHRRGRWRGGRRRRAGGSRGRRRGGALASDGARRRGAQRRVGRLERGAVRRCALRLQLGGDSAAVVQLLLRLLLRLIARRYNLLELGLEGLLLLLGGQRLVLAA